MTICNKYLVKGSALTHRASAVFSSTFYLFLCCFLIFELLKRLLNSPSYAAHWDESLAPALLLMATWTRLGPVKRTPLGRCKRRRVLSTEPPAYLPQPWRRSSVLSASVTKLVGKQRFSLSTTRTTGSRKESFGWRKKRSGVGQLGGGAGIDKTSGEGRPCLQAYIECCEKIRVAKGTAIFTAASFILK